jgi:8-oxo-dGTP diphosphatase
VAHSVIYLVRHAKAGERRMWTGDDRERPLSKSGWKQAHALGKRLTKKGVGQLVSSPYVRCIQTLEPLAIAVGSTVETDDRLLEDAPFEGVLDLIAEVDNGAVLCSHGDVIPDLLDHVLAHGAKLKDELRWQKASTWVLSWDGDQLTKGRYIPPPA